jgi:MinD-like ATPase involved in chromosome partitioning or flagellar assembly
MVIAVWGRDGIGKSTLCDALGELAAKQDVSIVIDTDLTQPTLTARVNGKHIDEDASLGKAISGFDGDDVRRYLHQHMRHKRLYYAGLTSRDEYLTYEHGTEADNAAQDFLNKCKEIASTVILDVSGQRTDPFLPAALLNAGYILLLVTPDVQGICWHNAVMPMLKDMYADSRVLTVAAQVQKYQDADAVAKASDIRFDAKLSYVSELRRLRNEGKGILECTTPLGIRLEKQIRLLYERMRGAQQ